ncbi:hypothetical protein D068_cds35760 [Bacillus atrophaeus UCMB-5137]|nr:hypothetical protein D068_cds35760 [Bacillus atrophaeus UCMB-5137]
MRLIRSLQSNRQCSDFITLTEGCTAKERTGISRKAAILSFFILTAFLILAS